MVDLDLYDNKIGHIHGLEELIKLENLDLSFNKIKHIKRINHLTGLKNLYFVQNRIARIEGLEGMTVLRNLELGANKIRVCVTAVDGVEMGGEMLIVCRCRKLRILAI